MKALFLILLPFNIWAQLTRQVAETLHVEWQKELNIPSSDLQVISGVILDSRQNLCVVSNQSGTKVFGFTDKTEPTEVYSIPSFLWWAEPQGKNFISREANCVSERDFFTGAIIEKNCYQMPPNWATTSPVSRMYNNRFYYAGNYFLCKFKKDGEVLFKKEVAESGNSILIHAGGGYIYLYGRYNTLSDTRLMQYDTLGNQTWSILIGGVKDIFTDDSGNCYAIVFTSGEDSYLNKYSPTGQQIWSRKIPGQMINHGSIHGKLIYLAGMTVPTIENFTGGAISTIDLTSGELLSQSGYDLYPDGTDEGYGEQFGHIVTDGENIYVDGRTGTYPKCYLVKLSKEGNTIGVKDEKANRAGFTIFPNPGGSKFTISCESAAASSVLVHVRNIAGQLVYDKKISCNPDQNFTLDLGKQPAGNYTVEIDNGKERVAKKIIVE